MTKAIERKLATAGAKRRQADELRHQTSTHLRTVVIEALDSGMSKSDVAKAAGVSRQTVYEMVGKAALGEPTPKEEQ